VKLSKCCLALAWLLAGAALPALEAGDLDGPSLERWSGLKGGLDPYNKMAYRLEIERPKLVIRTDGRETPFGATAASWATFAELDDGRAAVEINFSAFGDEKNLVMESAAQGGFDLKDYLVSRFTGKEAIYGLQFKQTGDPEKMARSLGAMMAAITDVRKGPPSLSFASQPEELSPSAHSITLEPLEKIFYPSMPETFFNSRKVKKAVFRFRLDRTMNLPPVVSGNSSSSEGISLPTTASIDGTDAEALLDCVMVVTNGEFPRVYPSMAKSNFNISTIRDSQRGGFPEEIEIHFWASGKAAPLAAELHEALGHLKKEIQLDQKGKIISLGE
jgi:hypothetical protein